MKKNLVVAVIVLFSTVAWSDGYADQRHLGIVQQIDERTYPLVESFGQWNQAETYKERVVYTYDTKGNVVREAHYHSNGLISYTVSYNYDTKGNIIDEAQYGSSGLLELRYVYTYDSKGNMIEKARYTGEGSLVVKYISIYDAKGNQIEEADYNADGSLFSKHFSEYDAKGTQTDSWYDSKGILTTKYCWTYDDKGNLVESTRISAETSANKGLDYHVVFTYDVKGNRTRQITYDSSGSLVGTSIFSYDYDSIGNWTKRTFSQEVSKFGKTYFQPSEITIRTITYLP